VDEFKFDEIGYWSEVKLDIIRKYAAAYSSILSSRKKPSFKHFYIDAFAGAGVHKAKASDRLVAGSPTNALAIEPPFHEYHFIDLNPSKVARLEELTKARANVHVHSGDCNQILLEEVLPRVKYEEYRRGLCLLDPYGLDLDWRVIAKAGQMKSIEIFLNFPVLDMNRNVLWRTREGVSAARKKRLSTFWGDESWRTAAYKPAAQSEMFGPIPDEKVTNEEIAEVFRRRLRDVAGFAHVPAPMAMRNSNNAIVYYLYFASQKPVAKEIVEDIFRMYRNRGLG
jgi:three-Cys-motif partner protein